MNPDHEFHYPSAADAVPETPEANATTKMTTWTTPEDYGAKFKQVSALLKSKKIKASERPKYPPRLNLSNLSDNSVDVSTNHFELHIEEKAKLFEYEIQGLTGEGRSKKKIQKLFSEAIKQWDFLRDNADYFTTDSCKTIVS